MNQDLFISDILFRLAIGAALGLSIGLERQRASQLKQIEGGTQAGARTFTLISLFGAVSAFIAEVHFMPIYFISSFVLVGILTALSYVVGAKRGDIGLTTEIACIIAFTIGALCWWQHFIIASAVTILVAAVLSFKTKLHGFSSKLTEPEVSAALTFALISGVVLPIIPNRSYFSAPFDILNPYQIWLMVVLISGLSFIGYVVSKTYGQKRGILLSGAIGGLISSTAATLSFAQKSRTSSIPSGLLSSAIIISWVIMLGRVLVEVAVVNTSLLRSVLIVLGPSATILLIFAFLNRGEDLEEIDQEDNISNPFQLIPALYFGVLYATILLFSRISQMYFGNAGVFVSSFVSGLADVDAITISLSELSLNSIIQKETAIKGIVFAVISNTILKGSFVFFTANRSMRPYIVKAVGLTSLSSLLMLAFI